MPKRILLLALAALPAAALAVPGGPIDSLLPGNFACEMPGDAASVAGYRVDAENFAILNANSYRTAQGRGTYLLTGDLLVLTSGPKEGQKFRRVTNNFLRKIGADGKDSDLRCVRSVVNNSSSGPCNGPVASGAGSCSAAVSGAPGAS